MNSTQNFVYEVKDDWTELTDSLFNLKECINSLNSKAFGNVDITRAEVEHLADCLDYIENDVKCMRRTIIRNN